MERVERADQLRLAACLINAGQYDRAAALLEPIARCEREASQAEDSIPPHTNDNGDCTLEPDRDDRVLAASNLRQSGDDAGAVALLRSAVAADPERAEYHYQLGTVLAAIGDYDEAELRFTQATAIMPDHADALVNLALCHGLCGRIADAVRCLQRAQAMCPEDARITQLLAHAAGKAARAGQCLRLFINPPDIAPSVSNQIEQLVAAESDCIDEFLRLAKGPLHERILAIVLQGVRTQLSRNSPSAALHHDCGRILARLGRHEQAVEEFERALALDSKRKETMVELARVHQATGRSTFAAAALERALAAGAECPDVLLQLGHAYKEDGKILKAASAFRRALALNRRCEAAQQALSELSA